MNAEAKLRAAYEEWRELAEAESRAISAGDWPLLSRCQFSLQKLQPRITGHLAQTREEWAAQGADRAIKEQDFRQIVAGLMELEQRNSALLTEARQAAQLRFDNLGQSSSNLRRLQRSYAPARPAAWTSFS